MISQFSSIVLLRGGFVSRPLAAQCERAGDARQITLVVPYSAGGGTDTVARLIGNQMSRTLGQAIIVENVVGAGGNAGERARRPLGAQWHHRADQPCGAARRAQLFTNLRYDTGKDFEAVGPRQ